VAGIITLTTDFGLDDGYVAAMKGVILGLNPDVRLVDISHQVPPGDIGRAAFILGSVYRFFPGSTVHLAVVDPGVGTSRRAIILQTPDGSFIGPDNGVLTFVIENYCTPAGENMALLSQEAMAVEIAKRRFFHEPVSSTFHGRDIFAPVAALLAIGAPLADFGPRVDSLLVLPCPRPQKEPDGSVRGHVQYIDHFGNLVTDIRTAQLPSGRVSIELLGRVISGLGHNYADTGELVAVIGSSGYLEVALAGGSVETFLGARLGDSVIVRLSA